MYYCPICGAGPFYTDYDLLWHIETEHPPPPTLSGEVVKGQVIVDGQILAIGSEVVSGTALTAIITAKNTSAISLEMGVYWQLLDPSSTGPYSGVRQHYSSPALQAGAGESPVFYGPAPITVDMEGVWFIYIELYGRVLGTQQWQLLQDIAVILCQVAVAVPPPLAGTITRKELDYDAVRVPFPVQ